MTGSHGGHRYQVEVQWTGNRGDATSSYRAYGRDHTISAGEKPTIEGSSDPAYLGDARRWNPEDMLVASLSTCHMLWYLHLCAVRKIGVIAYVDRPAGTVVENADASGQFREVVLQPEINIRDTDDLELAVSLHHEAHAKCFIANSVNFAVEVRPRIRRSRQDVAAAT